MRAHRISLLVPFIPIFSSLTSLMLPPCGAEQAGAEENRSVPGARSRGLGLGTG
jgi:hypothetical protein